MNPAEIFPNITNGQQMGVSQGIFSYERLRILHAPKMQVQKNQKLVLMLSKPKACIYIVYKFLEGNLLSFDWV
jgi:hypothetical protein